MQKIVLMSGAGNLFVVLDNRDNKFSKEYLSKITPMVCSKSFNKNFDAEGFLILQDSFEYDFDCLFFNPDGTSGMMCGNGSRCIVSFANKHGMIKELDNINFSMANNTYKAKILSDNIVQVYFSPLISCSYNESLVLDNNIELKYSYVNNGADHFVINYSDLNLNNDFQNFDLPTFGLKIQNQEKFKLNSINVNVYSQEEEIIYLRTFERGVFKETGACGTGAISTALVVNKDQNISSRTKIIPSSGEELTIHINYKANNIEEIILEGNAKFVTEVDCEF